ncbi:MAG: hypothetical protein HY748_10520, partial [Elusimicrobia bacterium]|nr:hypothetical protein [Elusimicrobiota bacterium]
GILACSCVFSSHAAYMSVQTTTVRRQALSKAAVEVQIELYRVTDELVAHLKGSKKADLAALEARLAAVNGKLSGGAAGISERERADLAAELKQICGLLSDTRALLSNAGTAESSIEGLLKASGNGSRQGSVDELTSLVSGLKAASEDPAQAAWVFERMKSRYKNRPGFKAQYGLMDDNGNFTVSSMVTADGKTVEIVSCRIQKIFGADKKLIGWEVVSQREARQAALSSLAKEALSTLNGGAGSKDLTAMVAALCELHQSWLKKLGFIGAAAGPEEEIERLRVIGESNKAFGLFLVQLIRYRIFVQEALLADAVPVGTRFEAWEVGAETPAGAQIYFHEEREGGVVYLGLHFLFKDQTTRFQGQSLTDETALIVVGDPVTKRAVRTKVAFGKDR